MAKSKAQKRMDRKARKITVHAKVRDAEDLYHIAKSLGFKEEDDDESRKMTNGQMTVNVVQWGQALNFDEWYVTDSKKNGKTLVIIDEARKCTLTYKNIEEENIRLFTPPSLPPVNGGWNWVS